MKPLAAPVALEDAAAEPLTLAKPVWTLLVVMVEEAAAPAEVALPVVFCVA